MDRYTFTGQIIIDLLFGQVKNTNNNIITRYKWDGRKYNMIDAFIQECCNLCGQHEPVMWGDTGSAHTLCDDCYEGESNYKRYLPVLDYQTYKDIGWRISKYDRLDVNYFL